MKLTKKWLEEKNACQEGMEWFLAQKETDPIKIIKAWIRKKENLDWANWLIVRVMKRKQYIAYAIFAAEQVLHIFEEKYPDDKRPREAIEAAKLVLKKDTKKNKAYAADAAVEAYRAAVGAVEAYAASAAYAAVEAYRAAYAAVEAYEAYAAVEAYEAYAADAADAAVGAVEAYAASLAAARQEMQIKTLKFGIKMMEGK